MASAPQPPVNTKSTDGIAPKISELTRDVLFGDIWERPQLCKRDRSMIVCATLITLCRTEQMPAHFGRALANGVTPTELVEMITQLAFYAGWPAAMSAIDRARAALQLFAEAGSIVIEPYEPKPLPQGVRGTKSTVADIAPKLAELTLGVLFDDIWERPGLPRRDRSLIVVACLTALGRTEQMPAHFTRALANGVTPEELVEVITHLAFYAGWPCAMSAIDRARTAIDNHSKPVEGAAMVTPDR